MMARMLARLAFVLVAGVATSVHAAHDAGGYEHANDQFGSAVAVDGDWAAVGAVGDNTTAFNAGAIYMYQRTDGAWALHSRLVPEDSDGGTWLGNTIALDGDTLLAGATVRGTNARSGGRSSARIYVRTGDGWRAQALLQEPGVSESGFGIAVALAGADAAVVSDYAIVDGLYRGPEVHVYRREGDAWGEAAVMQFEAGRPQVAFAGGMLAVATGYFDARVMLYRRDGDTWTLAGEIDAAAAGAAQPDFAEHIAAHGDTLAISDDRRVALFGRDGDTWTLRDAIEIDGAGDDVYAHGYAPLTLTADRLALGLFSEQARTEQVHLFARTDAGWVNDGVLVASDARNNDQDWFMAYGTAIAFAGDGVLVGAMRAGSPDDERSGAVYVYQRRDAATWDETQVLGPGEPSAGCDCRHGPPRTAPIWVVLVALTRRRKRRTR